jgi:arabinofuranosyltransferase
MRMTRRPEAAASTLGRQLLPALTIAVVLVVVRTAWMSDDAYVTLRSVQNFVEGYGPRWNPGERVQAFTHPLWMLCLSAAFFATREAYFTTLAVSIAVSTTAVALLLRQARSMATMALCAALLVSSKAFVDFSTSGLENPLTHLCLALVALTLVAGVETPRSLYRLTLATALVMLTRLDIGLLLLPMLVVATAKIGWRAALRPVALGVLPLVAWHAFALVYYGTPFPNPAYATMTTGVSVGEYLSQGLTYLGDSFRQDPVTLVAILGGTVLIVVARVRGGWLLAAGVLLQLAYVVRVGGDSMSGRLLTPTFFWVVLAIARLPYPAPAWAVPVPVLLVVAIGQLGPAYPLWSDVRFGADPGQKMPATGIVDERRNQYRQTGLMRTNFIFRTPFTEEPYHVRTMVAEGRRVVQRDAVGLFGFYAGRQLHVLDVFGLGDPLLARLPTERPWRIGHFSRKIPPGYEPSLVESANRIEDANLHRFYEDVRLATRGDLMSLGRWGAIVRLNLGLNRYWLAPAERGLSSRWSTSVPTEPTADGRAPVDVGEGLHLILPAPIEATRIELGLDRPSDYRVTALRRDHVVYSTLLRRDGGDNGGLSTRTLDLPANAGPIDAIEIVARRGDPPHQLGHLRFRPAP